MSELKVILATPHLKMKNACDGAIEVCLKSEVDRYISELIADQQLELDEWYCRVEHQKFMRCNLLIDYCGLKQNTCEEEKVPFWRKWYLRWCELSDKFKEAK